MRLSFVLVLSALAACSATKFHTFVPIGGTCVAGSACASGGVCANGICRTACSDTVPCQGAQLCTSGACIPIFCGDGVIHGNEECDDGNMKSDDGCSSSCKVELEFACSGEPSQCVPCVDADPLNCTLAFHYTDWAAWDECGAACGHGTQTRTRQCLRSDANFVDCAYCGGQCSDSQACTAPTECPPAYTGWSDWTTCTDNMQSRTRTCESTEDNSTLDCADCGGECSQSRACLPCGYGVNVVNCSPNVPGDPSACGLSLIEARDRCVETGCTWSGPVSCIVGGSQSNTSCYGGTANCQ